MGLLTVECADAVIGCAIRIHRELGPGLLESLYQQCMEHELKKAGLRFRRSVSIPVRYDGLLFGHGFRADLIVEDELLVELKAVDRIHPVHVAQVRSYLRLAGLTKGLLINFNVEVLKEGLRSVVLLRRRE